LAGVVVSSKADFIYLWRVYVLILLEMITRNRLNILQNSSEIITGLREGIATALLSYSPLWLRVGLEAILGEVVSLRSPRDMTSLKVRPL